jgi:hypothetical protein
VYYFLGNVSRISANGIFIALLNDKRGHDSVSQKTSASDDHLVTLVIGALFVVQEVDRIRPDFQRGPETTQTMICGSLDKRKLMSSDNH